MVEVCPRFPQAQVTPEAALPSTPGLLSFHVFSSAETGLEQGRALRVTSGTIARAELTRYPTQEACSPSRDAHRHCHTNQPALRSACLQAAPACHPARAGRSTAPGCCGRAATVLRLLWKPGTESKTEANQSSPALQEGHGERAQHPQEMHSHPMADTTKGLRVPLHAPLLPD